MVDADLFHRVVDGVDEVLERGFGLLLEDAVEAAGILTKARLRPDGNYRVAGHQGVGQALQRLQVEAHAQGFELVQGRLGQGLEVLAETDHLDHPAAVLDQLHLFVAEVARNIHQGARRRVRGDDRCMAQARDVFQGQGRHL
ncbi:hypothetical protein D3C80_1581410 [compost metagenome]